MWTIHKQFVISTDILKTHPTKERKVLIVFGDIIADVESNKKLKPIVTKLFIGGRQLNISHVFISQS